MKTIISGSRDFSDYALLQRVLERVELGAKRIDTVLSGTARGADQLGELWAKLNCRITLRFPAQWDSYGRSAGILRNREMAKHAEQLVAFWDGQSHGTAHMIEHARKRGLVVWVCHYAEAQPRLALHKPMTKPEQLALSL